MSELINISIQQGDFDCSKELASLRAITNSVGAIANFIGLVRDNNQSESIMSMELEHYPGMTERSIEQISQRAFERWALLGVRVIHRVGKLSVGDQIVMVAVSSMHRADAFNACEFIMDFLKTQAPFWKKEQSSKGEHWVDARASDQNAVDRW